MLICAAVSAHFVRPADVGRSNTLSDRPIQRRVHHADACALHARFMPYAIYAFAEHHYPVVTPGILHRYCLVTTTQSEQRTQQAFYAPDRLSAPERRVMAKKSGKEG